MLPYSYWATLAPHQHHIINLFSIFSLLFLIFFFSLLICHFTITHFLTFTYFNLFISPLLYILTLHFPHPFIFLLFWLFFSPFFDYKNLLFLFHSIHILLIKKGESSLSLSLSLSLYIYIYIFFILVDVWFFRLISFYVLIYFYYLFNFILFIYYMSSFEIIEWFTIILLHSMTWIIWYLELYTFLLNILLLILFYIILLFVSHSLPKKVIALSLSLSIINSFLHL